MGIDRDTRVLVKKAKPIGEMEPQQMAAKLREMGDEETAAEIEKSLEKEALFRRGPRKPYLYRTHQVGHFSLRERGSTGPIPIRSIGVVDPEPDLLNSRIDIHLDRLHVQEYPGSLFGKGEHHILVNFRATNQLSQANEAVSFSQTYVAYDGDTAGVMGYPVFIGLNVGNTGAAFEVQTVNVKNSEDEAVLSILDSDPFTSGLNLLTTAQPAIQPLTQLALGTARLLAGRSKNVSVQEIYLGLDAKAAAAGASLAQGNFVVAQVPSATAINWSEWVFDPNTGAVANKDDQQQALPYNYLIFRVTRHQAATDEVSTQAD